MRIRHSSPQRLELEWECSAGADGKLPGKPCSAAPHRHASSQVHLSVKRDKTTRFSFPLKCASFGPGPLRLRSAVNFDTGNIRLLSVFHRMVTNPATGPSFPKSYRGQSYGETLPSFSKRSGFCMCCMSAPGALRHGCVEDPREL